MKLRGPPQGAAFLGQLTGLSRLPPRVGLFYIRALARALLTRDRWTLAVVTRPRELARLVRLARGRLLVVEVGTASAWTAVALALADGARRIVTLDPQAHPERERYLALVGRTVRDRIELIGARAEDGPNELTSVELLFLDGAHEREATRTAFEAWRPALAPGAIVAFHDYGDPDYPGVAQAVRDLELEGHAHGTLFIARPA